MKTVYKYPIKLTDVQALLMPMDAEILSVGLQDGQICLWVQLDTDETYVQSRTIRIVGTGREVVNAQQLRFIGTVQNPPFVWHVFELED